MVSRRGAAKKTFVSVDRPVGSPTIADRIAALHHAHLSHGGLKRPPGGSPLAMPGSLSSERDLEILSRSKSKQDAHEINWPGADAWNFAALHDAPLSHASLKRPPSRSPLAMPGTLAFGRDFKIPSRGKSKQETHDLSWPGADAWTEFLGSGTFDDRNEKENDSRGPLSPAVQHYQSFRPFGEVPRSPDTKSQVSVNGKINSFLAKVSSLAAPHGASKAEIDDLDQIVNMVNHTFGASRGVEAAVSGQLGKVGLETPEISPKVNSNSSGLSPSSSSSLSEWLADLWNGSELKDAEEETSRSSAEEDDSSRLGIEEWVDELDLKSLARDTDIAVKLPSPSDVSVEYSETQNQFVTRTIPITPIRRRAIEKHGARVHGMRCSIDRTTSRTLSQRSKSDERQSLKKALLSLPSKLSSISRMKGSQTENNQTVSPSVTDNVQSPLQQRALAKQESRVKEKLQSGMLEYSLHSSFQRHFSATSGDDEFATMLKTEAFANIDDDDDGIPQPGQHSHIHDNKATFELTFGESQTSDDQSRIDVDQEYESNFGADQLSGDTKPEVIFNKHQQHSPRDPSVASHAVDMRRRRSPARDPPDALVKDDINCASDANTRDDGRATSSFSSSQFGDHSVNTPVKFAIFHRADMSRSLIDDASNGDSHSVNSEPDSLKESGSEEGKGIESLKDGAVTSIFTGLQSLPAHETIDARPGDEILITTTSCETSDIPEFVRTPAFDDGSGSDFNTDVALYDDVPSVRSGPSRKEEIDHIDDMRNHDAIDGRAVLYSSFRSTSPQLVEGFYRQASLVAPDSCFDRPNMKPDAADPIKDYWKSIESFKARGSFDSVSLIDDSDGIMDPFVRASRRHKHLRKASSMKDPYDRRYVRDLPRPVNSLPDPTPKQHHIPHVTPRKTKNTMIGTSMPGCVKECYSSVKNQNKSALDDATLSDRFLHLLNPLMNGETEDVTTVSTDDVTADAVATDKAAACSIMCGDMQFSISEWFC